MGRTQFFALCSHGLETPDCFAGEAVTQGEAVMVAGRDDDMLRLITVIDHQRRELDRIRASVAEDSVVARPGVP